MNFPDEPQMEQVLLALAKYPTRKEREEYLLQVYPGQSGKREQILGRWERMANDPGLSPEAKEPQRDKSLALSGPGDLIGTVIGQHYHLLEHIGEGGTGTVYRARQVQGGPFQRMVALKLIRKGIDTREIIERFKAEHYILSSLDHPNIAKVFDLGTTESGLPYLVMELVEGLPINDYCWNNHLPLRDRLKLFAKVCEAVLHAHQKGIIHRDIKPSNVLVTHGDMVPVVKIIDFGIAKVIDASRKDPFPKTRPEALIGTPEYMAPELARIPSNDVDTRADIFSLGILLYEICTGTTPLGKRDLERIPGLEVLRLVREEEPELPSIRLRKESQLEKHSWEKRAEFAGFAREVKGDLDSIVIKALQKDREKRYQTAGAFGRDTQRFLAGDMVEAQNANTFYRIRKTVVQYRGHLLAATLILLSLITGMIATSFALVETFHNAEVIKREQLATDNRQREIARANEILQTIFKDLNPRSTPLAFPSLKTLLGKRIAEANDRIDHEAIGDKATVAQMQMTLGETQLGLGNFKEALGLLEVSTEGLEKNLGQIHPLSLRSRHFLALAQLQSGNQTKGEQTLSEVFSLRKEALGNSHPDTLESLEKLTKIYLLSGKSGKAQPLLEEAVTIATENLGPSNKVTVGIRDQLSDVYQNLGFLELALGERKFVLEARKKQPDPVDVGNLAVSSRLAKVYMGLGNTRQAILLWEKNYLQCRNLFGFSHPRTIQSMIVLGMAYHKAGKVALALPLLEESFRLRWKKGLPLNVQTLDVLGDYLVLQGSGLRWWWQTNRWASLVRLGRIFQNPKGTETFDSLHALGEAFTREGKHELGLVHFEEALKRRSEVLGSGHSLTLQSMNGWAWVTRLSGLFDLAVVRSEENYRLHLAKFGKRNPATLEAMSNLAGSLVALEKWDQAVVLLEEVLTLRRDFFGEDAEETLTTSNSLAECSRLMGKWDESIKRLEASLVLQRKRGNLPHQEILKTVEGLALTNQAMGNRSKAISQFEEIYQWRLQHFGSDHPETNRALDLMGLAYLENKDWDKALALLEESYRTRLEWFGPENLGTLLTQRNLASCYRSLGDFEKALTMLEQVLSIHRERLGTGNPIFLANLDALAVCYLEMGKTDKAYPLMAECLKGLKANLGPRHREKWIGMSHLADCEMKLGKYSEALVHCEEAWNGQKQALGVDHPDTISTQGQLGNLYRLAGKPEIAVSLLEEGLARSRRISGVNQVDTLQMMQFLGVIYLEFWNGTQGMPLLFDSYKQFRNRFGPGHPNSIKAAICLIEGQLIQGQWESALNLVTEILELPVAKETITKGCLLDLLHFQAMACRDGGQWSRAERICGEALTQRMEYLGSDHPGTLGTLVLLKEIQWETGNYAKSEIQSFQDNLAKIEKFHGTEHPETVRARILLARAMILSGNIEFALPLLETAHKWCQSPNRVNYPVTLEVKRAWGLWNRVAGKPDEALNLQKEYQQFCLARLGKEHPRTRFANLELAESYLAKGEYSQTQSLSKDYLLSISNEKGLSANSQQGQESRLVRVGYLIERWQDAFAAILLGEALYENKEFQESAEHLLMAIQYLDLPESLSPFFVQTRKRKALRILIQSLEKQGKEQEARSWRLQLGR